MSIFASALQVFLFFCETCSVPICRECSMGRHMGHTFVYLQDAVQDCRAITIQLLADAQQGRQAVQVRQEPRQTHSQGIKRKISLNRVIIVCFYLLNLEPRQHH